MQRLTLVLCVVLFATVPLRAEKRRPNLVLPVSGEAQRPLRQTLGVDRPAGPDLEPTQDLAVSRRTLRHDLL